MYKRSFTKYTFRTKCNSGNNKNKKRNIEGEK